MPFDPTQPFTIVGSAGTAAAPPAQTGFDPGKPFERVASAGARTGNKPQRTNNPLDVGNDQAGHTRAYPTPEAGAAAWVNDFSAKAAGRTRTGLNGGSTIDQYLRAYDPTPAVHAEYAATLAKHGIAPTDTLAQIEADPKKKALLGNAMAIQEGWYAGKGETQSLLATLEGITAKGAEGITAKNTKDANGFDPSKPFTVLPPRFGMDGVKPEKPPPQITGARYAVGANGEGSFKDVSVDFQKDQPPYAQFAGQVYFDPRRYGQGIDAAHKAGLLDSDHYAQLKAQAPAVEASAAHYDDLVKQSAHHPQLKAALQGAGRGAASLGAAAAAGAATSELSPWVSFPASAVAAVGGAMGYGAALKAVAPYSNAVKSIQAASQLYPQYSAAGELAAFAVPMPSSIGKLAMAGRIVEEAKGTGAAAKYLAAQAGKGAAIGVATDAAFQTVGKLTGLQQGAYDPKSTAFAGLMGGILAGHGIKFRGLSTDTVADIVQRGLTEGLSSRNDRDVFEKAMAQLNALKATPGSTDFQGVQVQSLNGPATRLETVRRTEPVKLTETGPGSPSATPGPGSEQEFEALVDQNKRPVMRAKLYRDLGYPLAALDSMSDQEMSDAISGRRAYVAPLVKEDANAEIGGPGSSDPDWSVEAGPAQPGSRASEDIEAEAQHRRDMAAALRGANEEHGIDLEPALQELGGLPAEGSAHHQEFAGELRQLAEARLGTRKMSGNGRFAQGLFRPGARSLDTIAEGLREMGAAIEGPDDVLKAVDTWLSSGKPHTLPARDMSGAAMETGAEAAPKPRGQVFNADDLVAATPQWQQATPAQRLALYPQIQPAAAQARDAAFAQALAQPPKRPGEVVHVLMGGQSSGKSTRSSRLPGLVLDTTLANPDRAAQVIDQIKASGRTAHVQYVYRPIPEAMRANLRRAGEQHRVVTVADLARGHVGARQAVEAILQRYAEDPAVTVTLRHTVEGIGQRKITPSELRTLPRPSLDAAHKQAQSALDADREAPAETRAAAQASGAGGIGAGPGARGPGDRQGVPGSEAAGRPAPQNPAGALTAPPVQAPAPHAGFDPSQPYETLPPRQPEPPEIAAQRETLDELRAQPPEHTGLESMDDRGNPYAPVPLTGLADIKIIQMPELVSLARQLTGTLPELKKMRKARGQFVPLGNGRIKLNPQIFAQPEAAAKTLAHEIGHLIDYLPQQTLARGNLWGRLHSLRGYMKERWTSRGPTATDLRNELKALSNYWKPYNAATDPKSYVQYRESGVELYADFISVLFNSPATAKQMAPRFYREFFAGLDSKHDVKDAFFQLQTWLNRPHMQVLQDRSATVRQWFGQAEDLFERKMKERELRYRGYRGWLDRLKQGFFDTYAPIRGRAKGTPAEDAVRFFFDAHPLAENLNYRLLENLHRTIARPLEAAGHSLDELGEYLFFNRVLNERYEVSKQIAGESQIETGGRSVIANPGGHVPATARLGLLRMRLEKGPRGMTQIDRAAQKFHDTVFRVMQEAHRAGLLTDDQMRLIAGNRDTYATFTPLEYVDTFVPSGIRHQAGTFKEVANPYISTVLKMITMQRAIELQKAKQLAVQTLVQHFPGEIEPAETRSRVGGGKEPVPPRVKGQRQLMLREAGRPVWFNVPAEIAEMFERGDVPLLRSAVELLGAPFRKVFYPLFITFNPVFQLLRHPMREARRSFRNAPDGLFNTVLQGVRPELKAFVRHGDISPLIAEMLEQMVITPAEMDFISSLQRKDAFGQILRNFHLLPEEAQPAWKEAKLLRPAVRLFHWIEQTGHVNMLLPRVGVYKATTQELGWPREDAAFYVRNFIGVPNHMKKGKYSWIATPILPFLNVWTKGWAADLELATRGYRRSDGPNGPDGKPRPGKSAAAWWFRWASTSGVWTVMKVAASLGLMGAGIKKLMDGISTHDKLNYDVVPVATARGKDFGTKTVYLKIPQDQTDRLLSGLVYMLLTHGGQAMQGKGLNPRNALSDMFNIGTSDMPGVNPAISLANGWRTYLDGQNPIDGFRNRPVLTNDEYLAGGWPGLERMLGWTWSESGMQSFVSYNPNADSALETTLGSIPVVNGLVGVSDYGYREQQENQQHQIEAKAAQMRLSLDPAVQRLLQERSHLAALRTAVRTPEQAARMRQLNGWYANVYKPAEEAAMKSGDKTFLNGLKDASAPYAR
jgi:hypothetical protein